jgi:hypothetical protein
VLRRLYTLVGEAGLFGDLLPLTSDQIEKASHLVGVEAAERLAELLLP